MFRFIFVLTLLLLFDWYVFRVFRKQIKINNRWFKIAILIIYWLIPLFYLASPIYFKYFIKWDSNDFQINKLYFGASFAVLYIPKFIIFIFQVIEDATKFLAWVTKKLSPTESKAHKSADGISRSVFISRMGIFVAAIPFTSLIYSVLIGRFNFQLNKRTIYFDHLPKAFDGFKIVQFSDLHAGSLIGQQNEFKKAIDIINEQNADIVVFTGDMVNSVANELEDWVELLSSIKAKKGKYSIFGNHDYGSYMGWDKEGEQEANIEKLKQYQSQMGFKLLLNDTEIFEKNGEKIALLGVENWGKSRRHRKGRLDIAMEKAKEVPFKVLLSHDPLHWDQQVVEKTDIALTLSGHTHGLQMVASIGGFNWSPISYKYKRWKGLYTEKNQHLYVNNGLGYIYFPGRIGSDPEITVFELKTNCGVPNA